MVLGVQQDGRGEDESSSHAGSNEGAPPADDSKCKEEADPKPMAVRVQYAIGWLLGSLSSSH
jgi:hypothetical protein